MADKYIVFVCPDCFQRIRGISQEFLFDGNNYIHLVKHLNQKGNPCSPRPYNVVSGMRKP